MLSDETKHTANSHTLAVFPLSSSFRTSGSLSSFSAITGCSAGLGKSLAKAVLKKGYQAVVTARNTDTQRLFQTNFWGPIALMKAVLPGMRKNHSGAIINVSSIAAIHTAPPVDEQK